MKKKIEWKNFYWKKICQKKTCWGNNFCQQKFCKKKFHREKNLLENYLSEKKLGGKTIFVRKKFIGKKFYWKKNIRKFFLSETAGCDECDLIGWGAWWGGWLEGLWGGCIYSPTMNNYNVKKIHFINTHRTYPKCHSVSIHILWMVHGSNVLN